LTYLWFMPRDAMHKLGLCCHVVSVHLSVRLFITFMDSVKTSNCILTFFIIRQPDHSSFSIPNGIALFRWGLP